MLKSVPVKALINYIREVRIELGKVIWPKRKEVVRLTLIVFLISGIIGAAIGIVDYAFTKLLELIISV